MIQVKAERPTMWQLKLREWRQLQGLTQRELAAKSGVALATIQRLEQREHPMSAQPATRRKLAKALGISEFEILTLPPEWEELAASQKPRKD
jgi:transcriptional regulator with XRE-family HTH domain